MGPSTSTHVFQTLWIGPRLSPLEQLCIKSFLEHGFPFVLYAYDEVAGVPRGCRVADARAILGEDEVFTQQSGLFTGSRSTFSNRFRYELLQQRGGWWVDTDVLCLKAEIPDLPYAFAKANIHHYSAGVLKAPPDSEFLSEAIERSARAGKDVEFGMIGPRLVDRLVRELGLEHHAWAPQQFYPLAAYEALSFLDPGETESVEARARSATFVHFYTHMLGLANVLRDIRPPEGSYLDGLYNTYGIQFELNRRYDWAEVATQRRYQAEYMAISVELERLRSEVRRLEGERERFDKSVTIQLFLRLSDRLYRTIGDQSLTARRLRSSLQRIGRRTLSR